MTNSFKFTFKNIQKEYERLLEMGYQVITCSDYAEKKYPLSNKAVINRIDIDVSVKKAERLSEIYSSLGIKGSFFIRLHGDEYNPFSFENYRIIKDLIEQGHEIGYHSEVIDQALIWDEDPADCLIRDLNLINTGFGIEVKGVASHGGFTGFNNLDFWKQHTAKDFGLLYEAYDKELNFNLFDNSLYVSDSEWTRWKCYSQGKLQKNDYRTPSEHAMDNHELIYLLIHSDTYFDRHFYE
tara:strand:+ start:2724 stop:3440 length:717 start_codon:yes stop_codon:yes gene_type:complete